MQRRVYQKKIHSVDELKQRLIDVWCGLEQSIFWQGYWPVARKTSSVCPCQRRTLQVQLCRPTYELTVLILSISVIFNVTCLTVASCQQRWPVHSCSFYKVVQQPIWGVVVDFRVRLVAVNLCLLQWKNYNKQGGMAEWLASPDWDRKVVGSNPGVARSEWWTVMEFVNIYHV